jgi:hypothetical protein
LGHIGELSFSKQKPQEEAWTSAKIIDELIDDLARAHAYVVEKEFGYTIIVPKYYERAAYLVYRIPLQRPRPPFDIELSDLRLSVKREFAELKKIDPPTFRYVTKMAVSAIFENVNFEYFHRSVMRHLKVRFIP